jgi:hypothetical protein
VAVLNRLAAKLPLIPALFGAPRGANRSCARREGYHTTGWQIACCTAEFGPCRPGRLRPQGVIKRSKSHAAFSSASSETGLYPRASLAARNAALASCEGTLVTVIHVGPRLSHEQHTSRVRGKGHAFRGLKPEEAVPHCARPAGASAASDPQVGHTGASNRGAWCDSKQEGDSLPYTDRWPYAHRAFRFTTPRL